MTTFDAAPTNHKGVKFVVVKVKSNVIPFTSTAQETREGFSRHFPGMHVILMEQDGSGRPTYWGEPNVVRFLASIDFRRLPWKSFTLS